jgi:nucleoporin NUP82
MEDCLRSAAGDVLRNMAPQSKPTLVPSLANLSKHSIFIPPSTSNSKPEADWELLDAPEDDVPLKTSRVVVRDKDLIVAHGKEVRIASTGGDGWEVHDGRLGRYKVSRVLQTAELGLRCDVRCGGGRRTADDRRCGRPTLTSRSSACF